MIKRMRRLLPVLVVPALLSAGFGVYFLLTQDRRLAEQCAEAYWREHGLAWEFDRIDIIYSAENKREFYLEGHLLKAAQVSGFYLNLELHDDPGSFTCGCVTISAEITNDPSFRHETVRIVLP